MKKVIGILALLALVGNVAQAELLKNFKYDGKVEVNSVMTSNAGDNDSDAKDKTSDTDARVQVNMGFDVTDDVNAVVSAVKCNRQYGDSTTTDKVDTLTAVTFEQAYLHIKGLLGLDHKVGRQYYGNEGDLVIYAGPRSWPYAYADGSNALSVSGLDGYSGWYSNDLLNLHVVSFKDTEADGGGAAYDDADKNINGVAGSYKLSDKLGLGNLLNVGAYIYEKKEMQTGTTPNKTLDVVGVKADGKIEKLGLSYYGEMAKNYGRQGVGVNYTGSAILLGGKMEMDLIGKWTFMGEMASGTGDKTSASKDEDFAAIATDYRPGAVYGGVLGKTGLANLTTWNLGAKWNTPMFEKLTLSGKLYHFGYNEKVTSAGGQETDTIGNELNLCANWQHNENVGVKAYYGAFLPTSKYTKYAQNSATAKDDMVTAMGAALTVKFGSN